MRQLARSDRASVTPEIVDKFIMWAVLGTVVGAKLGYALFYSASAGSWLFNDSWRGGNSFHGGLVGMILSGLAFSRIYKQSFWALADVSSVAAPIGIFLVRIGNFLNGEIWGHPTQLPWGVVFEMAGPAPRHPTQLYEAMLEGLLILTIMTQAYRRSSHQPGWVFGVFLLSYGVVRLLVEPLRELQTYSSLGLVSLPTGVALTTLMLVFGSAIVATKSGYKLLR